MTNNCQDCSSDAISLTGGWFTGSPCYSSDCGGNEMSSLCIIYNGGNLSCSGINTGDSVEVALQKIDTQICAIIGDYSTYNMHCLPEWWEAPITTQEDFVDAITEYVCDLEVTTNVFIENTFATFETTIYEIIETIEFPGITCASASVIDSDSITQVLTKYCTKFGDIDEALDISSVVWNDCITVVGTPSTLPQGFQLLADQICTVYDLAVGGALPLFNNYGSCIGGTSSDSLVTTIGLIKDRLCLTDVVDFDGISWGCWGAGATTMQGFVEKAVSYLNVLNDYRYEFDPSDFVLTAVSMDPCQGQLVSLATPLNQDRFVAVSAGDASPSTLIAKVASSGGTIAVTNDADTTLNLEIATGDYGDITVSSGGTVWTIDNDVVTFAKMQNINTAKLLGRSTAGSGDTEEISIDSSLTLSAGVLSVSAAATTAISSLTAAVATNTIDNINYAQTWQWNSLSGANGLKLSSNSTAGSVQYLLSVDLSGAMAAGSASTTCAYFLNSHTGTNSTNNAIIAGASGGTDNYGIVCWGAGGQWGTSGGASIYAQGRMRIDGQIDTYGSTSGIVTIKPAASAGTWTLTLPTTDGNSNEFLRTDGSGVTSWQSAATVSTYTPTLFNTTNIAASTASVTNYVQIGNFVHVWGDVSIDATAAATLSEMGMAIPVASSIAATADLAGTGAFEDNTCVQIKGDATNDRATFRFSPVTDTNNTYSFSFSYRIV